MCSKFYLVQRNADEEELEKLIESDKPIQIFTDNVSLSVLKKYIFFAKIFTDFDRHRRIKANS